MAKALTRFPTVILLVLVFVVSGCASTGTGFKVKKKGIHAVVVGPKASQITIDILKLSVMEADVAFWVAKDKTKKLSIEFEKEVFANMSRLDNGRWRVNCKNRQCYSDEIKIPYVEGDESKNTYKYWQVLEDGTGRETADGIIIIDP